MEHPAILSYSEHDNDFNAFADVDGGTHSTGLFNQDLGLREANYTHSPHEVRGYAAWSMVRFLGDVVRLIFERRLVRKCASDGELDAATAFVDLLEGISPTLGS